MSAISSCPQCAKQVTLPLGAEPSDMVRCPLCQAEYTLGEALATAPPTLILINSLFVVGGEESRARALGGESVQQDAVHAETPRRGDAGLHLADTDLHLFSRGVSDLSGSPTIDLTSTSGLGDEEEQEFGFALAGTEEHENVFDEPATVPIDHSAEPVEADDAASLDIPDQDTELEPLNLVTADAAATDDRDTLDFDAEPASFEMNDAGEEQNSIDVLDADEDFDAHNAAISDEAVESFGFSESAGKSPAAGSLEASAADAPALKATPRRERRKPSMLAGLIIWSTSLPVAAILAYTILLWGFGRDPVGLAPKLPAFLVPAALAKPQVRADGSSGIPAGQQLAQASNSKSDEELPGFNSNVPPLKPKDPAGKPNNRPAAISPAAISPAAISPAATLPANGADEDDLTADSATAGSGTESGDSAQPDEGDESTPNDSPADDTTAADDSMSDETTSGEPAAADEEEEAEPATTKSSTTDVAEDSAMEAETGDAAAADEMADDAATTAPEEASTEVAENEPTEAPGADLTAPEEDETVAAAVGPRDNVRYSLDDVDRALAEVGNAGKAMARGDKEELKKLKSQYYRKLYQLAEVATFADNQQADPRAATQQEEVHKVLAGAAADRQRFAEIGKAAGKWMSISKGKEHQGIVLSGAVQGMSKQGDVYETKILLTDGAQLICVLSPQKLPLIKDEQVVVLGSIVSDPAKTVEGYQGTEPAAVWSGLVLKAPTSG